jgi:hypothetical protein
MEPSTIENYQPGSGAIQSPIDERDWTLASVGAPITYPNSVFLDTGWMVASMQAQQPCCVGCSGEEMVRQIIYTTTGLKCNPGTPDELSWRFVYAMAKILEGTKGYEMFAPVSEGTYPSLVAKVIRQYGVPYATFCPNDVTLTEDAFIFSRDIGNISQATFANALLHRSGADMTVPITEAGIQQALTYAQANKGAVMVLREIGAAYWTDVNGKNSWDADDIIPLRVSPVIAGHEEMLYGYDHEPGSRRMRIYSLNHWSPAWADDGRAWEYFDVWQSNIVEARTVVAALPAPVSTFKYNFTKTMQEGSSGPDVVALQHVLLIEGIYPVIPSLTGYYGPITKAAVASLQMKYAHEILDPVGLTEGTGIVGASTLKWLQNNYKI